MFRGRRQNCRGSSVIDKIIHNIAELSSYMIFNFYRETKELKFIETTKSNYNAVFFFRRTPKKQQKKQVTNNNGHYAIRFFY